MTTFTPSLVRGPCIPFDIHWLLHFNLAIEVDYLLLLDYNGHLNDLDVLFFILVVVSIAGGFREEWRGRWWSVLSWALNHFGSWRWCCWRLCNAMNLHGVVEAHWQSYWSRHHGDVRHDYRCWDSCVVPWSYGGGGWDVHCWLYPVCWQRRLGSSTKSS
jgi:hypothetical protein